MMHIITWIWGDKYGPHYLSRLRSGVKKWMKRTIYSFSVVEPAPSDKLLLKGCLCRLKMFSLEWQRAHGIDKDDRIVCLDLDLVITGEIDPLFSRDEDFVILQGANAANPCPFNGSVMMLRAGMHREVWTDLTLEKVYHIPYYEFPDDQGWLHHKVPNAAAWKVGKPSGIYAFKKPGWPQGDSLPPDARIVCFPGHRDPSKFTNLPWIKEHWGT